MRKQKMILRYTLAERVNHWLVALCFVAAAVSGLGFFFPSYNWLMNIFGTPQLARILHPFFGVVMFLAFLIMFIRYWKDNLIDSQDVLWAKNARRALLNHEVGDVGKYNFGQKCIFWAAIGSLILLLLSGIVIWRPYFAGYFPIPVIRFALLVHSVVAIGFMLVIIGHIYAGLLWVRGSVAAMLGGWVPADWAKKHHPRWYRTMLGQQQKTEEKRSR